MEHDSNNSEDSGKYHRKISDSHQEKIDTLIAEEQDPKIRLSLMVMSNINKSIAANTELTYAIHKEVRSLKAELESHISETEAVRNQGLGAYKVMRVVAPALWIIMGSVVSILYHNYDKFQAEASSAFTRIDGKLTNIETRMTFYGIAEVPLTDVKNVIDKKISAQAPTLPIVDTPK